MFKLARLLVVPVLAGLAFTVPAAVTPAAPPPAKSVRPLDEDFSVGWHGFLDFKTAIQYCNDAAAAGHQTAGPFFNKNLAPNVNAPIVVQLLN